MEPKQIIYDPSNLQAIFKASGLNVHEVAKALNVSISTLYNFVRNGKIPSYKYLVMLADFFAVPLDLISGRCSKEVAENILRDYGKHFMELRRAPYEAYLVGRRTASECGFNEQAVGEAAWPYNLLDAVFGEGATDYIVDAEHEAGIVDTINMALSKRQAASVLSYYRDNHTLDYISRSLKLSKEGARQTVIRAVRRLKHSSCTIALRYGQRIADETNALKSEERRLLKEKTALEEQRNQLESEYADLKKLETEVDLLRNRISDNVRSLNLPAGVKAYYDPKNDNPSVYALMISNLGLSGRPKNCLMRAGCRTVGDLDSLVASGQIVEIWGIGDIAVKEVIRKLKEVTGKDYSERYRHSIDCYPKARR